MGVYATKRLRTDVLGFIISLVRATGSGQYFIVSWTQLAIFSWEPQRATTVKIADNKKIDLIVA